MLSTNDDSSDMSTSSPLNDAPLPINYIAASLDENDAQHKTTSACRNEASAQDCDMNTEPFQDVSPLPPEYLVLDENLEKKEQSNQATSHQRLDESVARSHRREDEVPSASTGFDPSHTTASTVETPSVPFYQVEATLVSEVNEILPSSNETVYEATLITPWYVKHKKSLTAGLLVTIAIGVSIIMGFVLFKPPSPIVDGDDSVLGPATRNPTMRPSSTSVEEDFYLSSMDYLDLSSMDYTDVASMDYTDVTSMDYTRSPMGSPTTRNPTLSFTIEPTTYFPTSIPLPTMPPAASLDSLPSLRPTFGFPTTTTTADPKSSTLEGTCWSSSLSPGELLSAGYLICYPMNYPIHKLGIDSTDTLAYYVNDIPIWKAIRHNEDNTSCAVSGNCNAPMTSFRLQNAGSLAGYDGERNKIWDSHEDVEGNGEYVLDEVIAGDGGNKNALGDKVWGSTLGLSYDGVFIQREDVVTWQVLSPQWEAPTVNPVTAELTSTGPPAAISLPTLPPLLPTMPPAASLGSLPTPYPTFSGTGMLPTMPPAASLGSLTTPFPTVSPVTAKPTRARPSIRPTDTLRPTGRPTAQNQVCPGPPAQGCTNGMFDENSCSCLCIPPFCPDTMGDCTISGGGCVDQQLNGNCVRGVDCPWWVNGLKDESCITWNTVPAGLWEIYASEADCCTANFPYSDICNQMPVTPAPAKYPTNQCCSLNALGIEKPECLPVIDSCTKFRRDDF